MWACQKRPLVTKWHTDSWGRTRLVLSLLLISSTAAVLNPRTASGQMPPSEDMIPISELEIGTNDLIRVATSYADAIRELRTAQLSVKTLQALRPNANITSLEYRLPTSISWRQRAKSVFCEPSLRNSLR